MDGYFLSQGTDLLNVFKTSNCERTFNIIDSIIIDDVIRDSSAEKQVTRKRAEINKIYGRIVTEDSSNDEYYGQDPENASPQHFNDGIDEIGIPGMPPVG